MEQNGSSKRQARTPQRSSKTQIYEAALGLNHALRYVLLMTTAEHEILKALNELDGKVKSIATANPKPNLLPIFARLDELAGQLPKNNDPTLVHYLHKKSYEKARLYLLGREAENQRGTCAKV